MHLSQKCIKLYLKRLGAPNPLFAPPKEDLPSDNYYTLFAI